MCKVRNKKDSLLDKRLDSPRPNPFPVISYFPFLKRMGKVTPTRVENPNGHHDVRKLTKDLRSILQKQRYTNN